MQLPEQLLGRLAQIPGFDRAAFQAAHEVPPPVSVRRHPLKNSALPAGEQGPVAWCPSGVYLDHRPLFTADPAFHAGAYYVQEASSMFLYQAVTQLYKDTAGLRVLDLCAAPGGKSTLLASWLNGQGLLLSNDVIRSRASILEENMTRWGYMNTWVCSNDPRDLGRIQGYFDLIVTDAPCSGSGLFRKDPEALKEWSENNVQLCSERQQRILADVWPALKENGCLVYATCSYSQEEDEEILDAVAVSHDASTVRLAIDDSWGITEVQSAAHGFYGYRFSPDKTKGEGFFLAVMRKNADTGTVAYPRFRSAHNKTAAAAALPFLKPGDYTVLEQENKSFTALWAEQEADLQLLKQYVYLRRNGIPLGMPAQKEWIPEHDIALSVLGSPDLPVIDVDRERALRYLQKETWDLSDNLRGWHMVRYNGLGLGWVKGLGNRVNNYLPKHWRIRMNLDL